MQLPELDPERVLADEHGNRDYWLEARKKLVSASDVPVLFGEGFGDMTAADLGALKRGEREPDPSNIHMRLGHHVEPFILQEVQRAHPSIPWQRCGKLIQDSKQPLLGATPDAVTLFGTRLAPVQIKHTAYGSKGMREEIKPHMLLQVQAEIAVMDAPLGVLACLHKHTRKPRKGEELSEEELSPLQLYHVERNEGLIHQIRDAVANFWAEEMTP